MPGKYDKTSQGKNRKLGIIKDTFTPMDKISSLYKHFFLKFASISGPNTGRHPDMARIGALKLLPEGNQT